MNTPKNVVTGRNSDHFMKPVLLQVADFRYHLPVYSLANDGLPVIMWSEGATSSEGRDAGIHDGLRDGRSSGRVNMKNNYVRYCAQLDWLEAGNAPLPGMDAELVAKFINPAVSGGGTG